MKQNIAPDKETLIAHVMSNIKTENPYDINIIKSYVEESYTKLIHKKKISVELLMIVKRKLMNLAQEILDAIKCANSEIEYFTI